MAVRMLSFLGEFPMKIHPQDSDVLCSRCGSEAKWRYLDPSETKVEIDCTDCGRFEISRAELEQAEFDIVPAEDRP